MSSFSGDLSAEKSLEHGGGCLKSLQNIFLNWVKSLGFMYSIPLWGFITTSKDLFLTLPLIKTYLNEYISISKLTKEEDVAVL